MQHLEALRGEIQEPAKDLKINLSNVLKSDTLSESQAWGVLLAAGFFVRHDRFATAALADARAVVTDAVVEDAKAAAALMGMNTVFYRFRHLVEKEEYGKIPARLRMQRMASPAGEKLDFELYSLACAALAGCGACIQAHEQTLLDGGLTSRHVHDAVRIAAVVSGFVTALELPS